MDLSICSFNCCSLRKNIDIVRELALNEFDVIFLQETFLTEDKLGLLDYIDEDYECVGVGAVYSERALFSVAGRPQGGMACLWKLDSPFKVDNVILENNLCVLFITIGNIKVLLVNVYFNSDIGDIATQSAYLDNMAKLGNILSDYNFNEIFFMGDFNADPFNGRAWSNLHDFMEQNGLKCFDYEMLDSSTVTFTSYDGSFSKWLDHMIGRESQKSIVKQMNVHKDMIGSDHLPLSASLWFDCRDIGPGNIRNIFNEIDTVVEWQNLTDNDFEVIEAVAMQYMGNFLDLESVLCKKVGCNDKNHLLELTDIYRRLVTSVSFASQRHARAKRKKNKYRVIPGWNRRVKSVHKLARDNYLKWLENGRERNTNEFNLMKNSRREFKQALNECIMNEQAERDISIEEKYKQNNYSGFWKDVKQRRINTKKSNIIDGKTINEEIINVFTQKFLLNVRSNYDYRREENMLINNLREIWETSQKSYAQVSADSIRKYCKSLNTEMGHDGLHSIFLQRASNIYMNNVAHFMNASFNHCFIPEEVLRGGMNPRIKDIKGNVTDSANYRPVMQSSCFFLTF